jgi:hypothetical protein
MLCYKRLWTVEQTFRTAKHLFSTRLIFHKLDETIRGTSRQRRLDAQKHDAFGSR